MTQKHTPGPWAVDNSRLFPVITDETGKLFIGKTHGETTAEMDANAVFIVRACNSHYDLLEAAKMGLSVLESEEGSDKTQGDIMRSAIAKAEGGQ